MINRFLRAVFPGLIPAFRSHHLKRSQVAIADAVLIKYEAYLSALFYWHLTAFFDRNFNALFGGNLPAPDLRNLKEGEVMKSDQRLRGIRSKNLRSQTYVGTNLLGSGATTLLGHLLATLVRHLMARRISHLEDKRS